MRRLTHTHVRPYSCGVGDSPARFPASLVARAVLTAVLCGFFAVALSRVGSQLGDAGSFALAAASMFLLLVIQVGYFARPGPYGRWRYVFLVIQSAITYLPLVAFGQAWIGLPGFFAGSLLLVLPPLMGGAGAALVVMIAMWEQSIFTGLTSDIVYVGISTTIASLVTWGLTRLAHVVVELDAARDALARLEVARERLRIARDLHDALGSTLTAVTLRTELTRARLRKDETDFVLVDAELADIARLSRQALTEVRAVSAGPLRSSVEDAVAQARELLEAAGVTTKVGVDLDELPVEAAATVAAVVRESVTNVLRHGGGRLCELLLRRVGDDVVLAVVNDLESDQPPVRAGDGYGISNLRARVHARGGSLTADRSGGDRWVLRAVIPVGPTTDGAGDGSPAPVSSLHR